MVKWSKIWSGDERGRALREETASLLPTRREEVPSAIPAEQVTRIALKLKYQVEQVIPCELEEDIITKAHSSIITDKVVQTAKEAGGKENGACVIYCLLMCKKWFKRQALLELWDADMHNVRALACEVIAKRIIESEEDMKYLQEEVLLKRFATLSGGEETASANVIERAVDLHAVHVMGSSGYQKCVEYLWRGWVLQDEIKPSQFVPYKKKTDTSYWAHLDPDRMRVPMYQNALQILISFVFLVLYTISINTQNADGDLDVIEAILYIFTLGFMCDEFAKVWKVGRYYFSFWAIFNNILYLLLTTSFITRMIALAHPLGDHKRVYFNVLSYNFLAFTAPMFWLRLLLYLDTFRFFGTMLVVIKVMMTESAIFFMLLTFVIIGFLQAFIGLDQTDRKVDATAFVMQAMANVIMTSPDFDGFEDFSHPFGIILYYLYTFVVMVVLLNILIALYNSAYEDITEDAVDEYMALFAQKTLQFSRAPDENVFIAPFNLIELFFLIIPLEWWLDTKRYERLNNYVMGFLYWPLLLITAFYEQRQAKLVTYNRKRGKEDDDTVEEWEELGWHPAEEDEEWQAKVEATKPNVAVEGAVAEVQALRKEVQELKDLIMKLVDGKGDASSDA